MDVNKPVAEWAVKAKTTAFGNFIDPDRVLVDVQNLAVVELTVPEYERNGLGTMVAKIIRYEFVDIKRHGAEAMSIGADTSRPHMVYEDMKPKVWGSFEAVVAEAPEIAKALVERRYGPEMVVVGVIKALELGIAVDEIPRLIAFLNKYHRRASWMETHGMEVRMANMEALIGNPRPFAWDRIFPDAETGEL